MQGPKTHAHRISQSSLGQRQPRPSSPQPERDARKSEFPVSWQGMNQESQHNKHNDSGQSGCRSSIRRG